MPLIFFNLAWQEEDAYILLLTLTFDLYRKGGPKSHFLLFLNEIHFQLNKACYKVSLCENFRLQTWSVTIPQSNSPCP